MTAWRNKQHGPCGCTFGGLDGEVGGGQVSGAEEAVEGGIGKRRHVPCQMGVGPASSGVLDEEVGCGAEPECFEVGGRDRV